MSLLKLIIIQDIKVQNANAVSGFVHSALSPTQILGFTHALNRKLQQKDICDIALKGSALIVKDYHTPIYKDDKKATRFMKSRNQPCILGTTDFKKPYVTENATMNITLSLMIAYEGTIDNIDEFYQKLERLCYFHRMGGGTILNINKIRLFQVEEASGEAENQKAIRGLMRSLLPGFVLYDRSDLLAEHKQTSQQTTLTSWFDFISLKQYAIPKHDLIDKHFVKKNGEEFSELWQQYLQQDYRTTEIPDKIISYFEELANDKKTARQFKSVIKQWQEYYTPNHKTDAQWHYQPKPQKGFLVPIMCGYKSISPVYRNTMDNIQVKNTRDIGTDVCFTEAVHSIGEWQGIHRIKTFTDLLSTIWCNHYEDNWYLCKQNYQPTLPQKTNPYL